MRTSPPSLLLLTPGFGGADGISAVSRSALEALTEPPGVQVELASLADSQPWPGLPPGRQCLAAGSRARLSLAMLRRGLRPNTPRHVLILHLHLAPLASPFLCRGARSSVFLHGIEAWRALRGREAVILRRSHLIANSHSTAERFRAANPTFQSQPVAIAHLGIPLRGVEPASSIPAPRNFALIVGRMASGERYKGHDQLIDLWPEVMAQAPGAHLVIAGDGDDRARLEQKTRERGLADWIHFTGRISDEALAALYRDCRFFLMPSSGEGFGIVFLEAMRAGKACLAGRGAAEEIVISGQTGCIVDSIDPHPLRDHVIALFRDRAATEAMGLAGRRRFLDEFTNEQFARRLRRALELPEETETASCAASPAC